MNIVIGADHAGFETKEYIKKQLERLNYQVTDVGTHDTNSVNYPAYAKKVAKQVLATDAIGILVCGTGIGMSIAANKIKGIRAAHPSDVYEAKLARQHNHANIMTLRGRKNSNPQAWSIVHAFLLAKPDQDIRHKKRLQQISRMEQ